jgi:hypothetical protein
MKTYYVLYFGGLRDDFFDDLDSAKKAYYEALENNDGIEIVELVRETQEIILPARR